MSTRSFLLFVFLLILAQGCSESGSDISSTIPTGKLRGRVALGNPDSGFRDRSGVLVELEGTDLSAVTTSDGFWEIEGVPTRTYTIKYSKSGFGTHISYGVMFVGGGTIVLQTTPLYEIPSCPAVFDDVRQSADVVQLFAHASCRQHSRRDIMVFYLSHSPDVSNENYDLAVTNGSQAPGEPAMGFFTISSLESSALTTLSINDSIYAVAYNSGGGQYTSEDQSATIYSAIHPEASRRLAFLIKK